MSILAVLLAAGGGTRYAGPTHKLLAPLAGRTVAGWSIAHLDAAAIGTTVVITGATELALPASVVHRHNPDWASGQASSIAIAVAEATIRGAEFLVIGLADQPGIPPTAWRAVAAAAPEHLLVVAAYDGRRGPHPVRLHRSLWPLLPTAGDDGARQLVSDHAAILHEVACEGSPLDIDTLEDAQRWKSS